MSKTALSVNLNKVATIRNTRHLQIPSVIKAAITCIKAGASGITVHPRPDERHIRRQDVYELAQVIKDHKHVEFNIEGNPFHNLMQFVEDIRPDQVTFVPDSVDQPTSDHGWKFPQDFERLRPLVGRANELGVRVSLFMDALPEQMHYVKELGAQRVELYTEPYAAAYGTLQKLEVLHTFVMAAQTATEQGLALNAGHDLNLENLGLLIESIPQIQEVSIGHAFIADSLEMGYEMAVKAYLSCMQNAHGARS
jgi:pyridoxine 5-phosphate synthase